MIMPKDYEYGTQTYAVSAKTDEGKKLYWTGRAFVEYGMKPLKLFRGKLAAYRCALLQRNTFEGASNLSDFRVERLAE